MTTATGFSRQPVKLLERSTIDPKRVDRAAGVIRNVKVLGLTSLNGRTYTKQALASAVGMYEGCKVNIDHPSNPNAPRSVHDRFGWLQNIKLAVDGLRGDLHFNPHHPAAARVIWDAENRPENLGLSHNAIGETTEGASGTTVHRITRVNSVDLVADPATTKGLFESQAGTMPASGMNDLTIKGARVLVASKADDGADVKRRYDLIDQARDLLAEAVSGLADDPAVAVEECVKFSSLTTEQRVARWRE